VPTLLEYLDYGLLPLPQPQQQCYRSEFSLTILLLLPLLQTSRKREYNYNNNKKKVLIGLQYCHYGLFPFLPKNRKKARTTTIILITTY
jgi:hypothetical protein